MQYAFPRSQGGIGNISGILYMVTVLRVTLGRRSMVHIDGV